MLGIIDKVVLFIVLCIFYGIGTNSLIGVIPVLIVISLSCLNTYLEKVTIHIFLLIVYTLLCFFLPELLLFFPLICYDVLATPFQFISLIFIFPAIIITTPHLTFYTVTGLLFMVLTYYIKHKSLVREKLKTEYLEYRDKTTEMSIALEKKNAELLEKQDYEINIATLNERNRIAMEIHDNVGHLLSSAILQVGAILATNQNSSLNQPLETLTSTLSTAMNSIRDSVHNIHKNAIQLKPQIQSLVSDFNFCPITLDYQITSSPNEKISYTFIAILKEGLSNIIKHSNATQVLVTLREHPGFYQFILEDNGTIFTSKNGNGIGIQNMEERVSQAKGNLSITTENGFRIFISIPKEESK